MRREKCSDTVSCHFFSGIWMQYTVEVWQGRKQTCSVTSGARTTYTMDPRACILLMAHWLHLHAPCQLSVPVPSKVVNLSKAKAPSLIAEDKSFLTFLPSAAALASLGLTPSPPVKLFLQRVSPLLSLCSGKPWERGRSFCADHIKAWFQPSVCDGMSCSCGWPMCGNM